MVIRDVQFCEPNQAWRTGHSPSGPVCVSASCERRERGVSCISERREGGGRVSQVSGCVIMEGWLPAWVGQDHSIP